MYSDRLQIGLHCFTPPSRVFSCPRVVSRDTPPGGEWGIRDAAQVAPVHNEPTLGYYVTNASQVLALDSTESDHTIVPQGPGPTGTYNRPPPPTSAAC